VAAGAAGFSTCRGAQAEEVATTAASVAQIARVIGI
jgi:hypothetical protein